MNTNAVPKITFTYILLLFVAVFATTILHELAHWAMGEILGNRMVATLNGTNPISGTFVANWHRNFTTAAGPLFTIFQALLFYFVILKYRNIKLYPFLFFPFVMRFAAGLANFMGPNDEGRLGLDFGIGLFSLSIIVCLFLLTLVYSTSKKMRITFVFNLISFVLCIVFLLFLTFIDAKFQIKII